MTLSSSSEYDSLVNTRWPWPLPPISREEATRAARRIVKHFGHRRDAGGQCDVPWNCRPPRIRKVWVAARRQQAPGVRGWARLVHDTSHYVFSYRHPTFRPHDGGHAQLEAEIQAYVLAKGWLDGRLRPITKRLTLDQRRANKLARCEESLKRWDAKYRRAENALRKLRARRKVLTAVLDASKLRTYPLPQTADTVSPITAGADNVSRK